MQLGIETAVKLLILLLGCWTTISSASILTDIPKSNPLGIDWYPAPSPEDGPPLSAGASRNPALLPVQIGSIVGAYLVSACIVSVALIWLSRKLRRLALQSEKALDIEMVEPRARPYYNDPSPVSLAGVRNFSWPSPVKNDPNPYVFPTTHGAPRAPPGGGDPFVNKRTVEADREMLQRDLEDIYAHVMEQEEAKAKGINPKEMPPPISLQTAGPVHVAAPQRSDTAKIEKVRPSNIVIEEPKSPKSHSRSSSIISSLKSPKRKGVKGYDFLPNPVCNLSKPR